MKQIASRIPDETFNQLQTLTSAEKTISALVNEAISAYLAGGKTGENDNPEQTAIIETLKTHIQSLETTLTEKEETNNALKNRISELENAAPVQPSGIVLELSEKEKQILELANQRINARTGKTDNIAQMLFRLFYAQLTQGPGDWLPEILNVRQIERIQAANQ